MKSDSDYDSATSSDSGTESREIYRYINLRPRYREAPNENSFASSFPTIEKGNDTGKNQSNSQSESTLAECSSVFQDLNINDDRCCEAKIKYWSEKNKFFQGESVPSTSAEITSEEIPLHEEQERIHTNEESSLELLDCRMQTQTKLSLEPNLLSSLVLKNKKAVNHHETEVPPADAVKRKLKRSLSEEGRAEVPPADAVKRKLKRSLSAEERAENAQTTSQKKYKGSPSEIETAKNSEIMETTAGCSYSFKEGRKRKWCDYLDSCTWDASNPLNAVASTSSDFSCLSSVEETSFIEEEQVSLNMPSDPALEPGNHDSPQPRNISKKCKYALSDTHKRAPLSFRSSKKVVRPPVSSDVKNAPYVSRSETAETQGEKHR